MIPEQQPNLRWRNGIALALTIMTLLASASTSVARALPIAPQQKESPASIASPRQKAFVYQSQLGRLPYLLYLPKDYGTDPNKKWPLLVFLHGSGEAGRNAEIVRRQALPKILEGMDDFPFVVSSPQAPSAGGWGYATRALGGLLDEVQADYRIDVNRVSLTGWSMGGYGVWWMAKAMPTRFAALVPVAGGYIYNAKQLCPLSKIPTWVFHGKKDRNVQFVQSQVVVKALTACGGTPIFTQYDDAEHYVTMNRAYTDPKLVEWLLAQTRAEDKN